MSANKLDFLGACNYSNQELFRIDSEEKQSYVEMVSGKVVSTFDLVTLFENKINDCH